YGPGTGAGRTTGGAQEVPFDFGGFDFSDFAGGPGASTSTGGRTSTGGFRDIFSSIFGGRTATTEPGVGTGPQPGSDLEYQVSVGFWQAIRGAELRINISRQDLCANCGGRGYIESTATCPECNGKGQVTQTSGRMKFNVPCSRCGGSGHQ